MPDLPSGFLTRPIAHRALHDIKAGKPENSLEAVRAAVEAGYGIEIDIQRSADDVAMVFHDYGLARLTSRTGQVADFTAEELRQIPLRGGQEGIPTLAHVLERVAGAVPLLIEIKDQDGDMGPSVGPVEASVAKALAGYAGPVAVMSFNPFAVEKMAELAPSVPRGLVTAAFRGEHAPISASRLAALRAISSYEALGCGFISHNHRDLGDARVSELKASGAHILCWTVRSPAEEAQARKIADNITFEHYRAPFPS